MPHDKYRELINKYKYREVGGKFIAYTSDGIPFIEATCEGGRFTWRINKIQADGELKK